MPELVVEIKIEAAIILHICKGVSAEMIRIIKEIIKEKTKIVFFFILRFNLIFFIKDE